MYLKRLTSNWRFHKHTEDLCGGREKMNLLNVFFFFHEVQWRSLRLRSGEKSHFSFWIMTNYLCCHSRPLEGNCNLYMTLNVKRLRQDVDGSVAQMSLRMFKYWTLCTSSLVVGRTVHPVFDVLRVFPRRFPTPMGANYHAPLLSRWMPRAASVIAGKLCWERHGV